MVITSIPQSCLPHLPTPLFLTTQICCICEVLVQLEDTDRLRQLFQSLPSLLINQALLGGSLEDDGLATPESQTVCPAVCSASFNITPNQLSTIEPESDYFVGTAFTSKATTDPKEAIKSSIAEREHESGVTAVRQPSWSTIWSGQNVCPTAVRQTGWSAESNPKSGKLPENYGNFIQFTFSEMQCKK
ncbi:unnamed protein product [Protopolystoma xenopodis]|uniref:Uncharacterized protein n=1 Tax=Protopolystoma xenopodis TaxID=117903 RepID=A0A448XI54_9PLAT|nr:unnamed protein product [Protopolystoma xenopodis]